MGDSIGRIIPPSVSVDRGGAISQERKNRNRDKGRKHELPAAPDAAPENDLGETAEDTNKGKILDINA